MNLICESWKMYERFHVSLISHENADEEAVPLWINALNKYLTTLQQEHCIPQYLQNVHVFNKWNSTFWVVIELAIP